jgi:predicted hydrolase (HD superfamily)
MTHLFTRQTFGDPANAGKSPTVEEAMQLLDGWVKNDRLKLHMKQVAQVMKAWAAQKENLDQKDQHRWYVAGLLHDADWDQWPEEHCRLIVEELERRNTDPEIIHAIASHGPLHFGVEPVTRMDLMLYAIDELSGFIHAYSLMRPNGYEGMEVKGAKKRLKDKTFAAGVSREDINDACSRAGIPLDELIAFIIANQTADASDLTPP